MILTDTSVLIDFVRAKDARLNVLFPTLLVAICGVSRAEVLRGSQGARHHQRLLTFLNSLQQLPISDSIWDAVGRHLALLQSKGIILPFPDVVIASVAVSMGIELWTRDKHFSVIQTVLPALRLFQEPP